MSVFGGATELEFVIVENTYNVLCTVKSMSSEMALTMAERMELWLIKGSLYGIFLLAFYDTSCDPGSATLLSVEGFCRTIRTFAVVSGSA